jgi:hypothetical protein
LGKNTVRSLTNWQQKQTETHAFTEADISKRLRAIEKMGSVK